MDNQKLTTCKHCGATIAKSAKICPHCGGRNKRSKLLTILLILLLAVVGLFFVAIIGKINGHDVSDDAITMTEEDYKASCEEISYDELARNADNMIGKKVAFTGEVLQVSLDAETIESEYRVSVTKDPDYGWYTADDVVYLFYNIEDNGRILEGDNITFYGEVVGLYTYTSVGGANITIPAVKAVYVSLNN